MDPLISRNSRPILLKFGLLVQFGMLTTRISSLSKNLGHLPRYDEIRPAAQNGPNFWISDWNSYRFVFWSTSTMPTESAFPGLSNKVLHDYLGLVAITQWSIISCLSAAIFEYSSEIQPSESGVLIILITLFCLVLSSSNNLYLGEQSETQVPTFLVFRFSLRGRNSKARRKAFNSHLVKNGGKSRLRGSTCCPKSKNQERGHLRLRPFSKIKVIWTG